ncbi:MAG: imidazole glycerol phosphate synthase subunit HisH, partial [Clostridia bacterium]|nr:imidazole glycerol phosphate synthase subunit HisH [Clostridia bacterium]
AKKLETSGLGETVKEAAGEGKPVLGICLGMQLLVNESLEYGRHKGLGLIPGRVEPLSDTVKSHKIPHMGWNSLRFANPSKLYRYVSEGDYVYFVHSYQVKTDEKFVSATVGYEDDVTASIEYRNVFATQFHPEKSGNVGLKILKAFCETKT